MRIFVVGTGRCGTVTFSKAASHATNYTVGHESKAGRVADWEYPDNHIEVSSQLVIAIPILREIYPDAKWVWMIRDRDECVKSLARLDAMDAFSFVFFQQKRPYRIEVASAVYDLLNGLCDECLPRNRMVFLLRDAKESWKRTWTNMWCEGDFDASLKEWDTKYNEWKGA